AVAFQRGLIALLRGDARAAVTELEPALLLETRIESRTHERMQRAAALGVRAVAHAALGEDDRAEQDARAAEEAPEAPPAAIARASLARAIVLAKRGDGPALGELLARRGAAILTSVTPRERALVRALRKLGRARGSGAYREAGVIVEPSMAPHELADWVGAIVPEAAPFTTHDPSANAAPRHHALPRARKKLRVPIMAGAVTAFGAVAWILAIARAATMPHYLADFGVATFFFLALGALWPFVALVKTRNANKTAARMLAAQRALATGDEAGATKLLESLPSRSPALEATAALCIAEAAERRADFASCRLVCADALARLGPESQMNGTVREVSASLLAQSAAAAAGAGDDAAAAALLAQIETHHVMWGGLAAARFRVQLLRAMHAGDLARAQHVAKQRSPDLVVSHRDELLAELAFGSSEDVEKDIAQDPMLRAWVSAVTRRGARIAPSSPEPEMLVEEESPQRRARRV
ncbi:MAG TPA: hypothetical protein VIF62_02685, partial [Labilithrix sp.]